MTDSIYWFNFNPLNRQWDLREINLIHFRFKWPIFLSVPENRYLIFKRILIKYMTKQYTSTLLFSVWEDSHETQINLEHFNILLINRSHVRAPWWISRSQFRKNIIRLISVFSHWRSRFLSSTFYRSVGLSSRIPPGSVFAARSNLQHCQIGSKSGG